MLRGKNSATHAWRQVEVAQNGSPLFFNQNKDLILLFDGEIFYQDDLRTKLRIQGGTAEELILEAYELWGEKFLQHIEGDFALAILDKKRSKLLLARDRLGKKPLYWSDLNGHFLFGSELKGLLATGIIPQKLSKETLATYLAFGYCPQDCTLIQDVNKLLPAHFLVLDQFKKLKIESYWSLSTFFDSRIRQKPETSKEGLQSLLADSVKERSRKKEVGSFLSGGLGSGSISWFLKREVPGKPLPSFSTYFEGENEEDKKAAEQFSKAFSSSFQVDKIVPGQFLNPLSEILWEIEEPIADPNLVAIWHLSKMPPAGMAIFSGMGSDELLAGHTRYTLEERELGPIEQFFSSLSLKIKRGLIPAFHFLGSNRAYDLLRQVRVSPFLTQYVHQNLLFQKRVLSKVSPSLSPLFDPIVFLEKFHNLHKISNPVSAFIYLDFKTSLTDFYSEPFERLSFKSKFYWETPFLDQRVIEYAARIPEPADLSESETGMLLKEMMRPHFSHELVERPKRIRRAFLSTWVHDPSILPTFLSLRDGYLVEQGYVDKQWIESKLATPALRQHHFRQLFSLVVLEEWIRLFIQRPAT